MWARRRALLFIEQAQSQWLHASFDVQYGQLPSLFQDVHALPIIINFLQSLQNFKTVNR